MKVGVVGTGYVGLVTGVVLADQGNEVVCVDNDRDKVESLRRGVSPIYEPGIDEMLERTLRQGRLRFSESIAEATDHSEVLFIAVGTPPGDDGAPDLSAVRAVAEEIAASLCKYTIVVNKSTVPVGSGEMVEGILVSHGVEPELFDVVSNPEFLREGSAIQDSLHPDRIIVGAKRREAAERLVELYASFDAPVIVTDVSSAELIKYGANSYLAMKISFINAMSRICELAGANIEDVAAGIGADNRIGKEFLRAGLGWGGSCLPKDVRGMINTAERLGYEFRLLSEVELINEDQTKHCLQRLSEKLGGLRDKTIGMMGLSFKPNTDDIREAKPLAMISQILAAGGHVRGYDPVAMDRVREVFPNIDFADSAYEVSEGADAVILATDWTEFRYLDLERLGCGMRRRVLFDGGRVYSRQQAARAGFDYTAVGLA